eukprot:TRINITY_DN19253_c0_g1_i1.p1 TRINITY_DN19253_c0_g1~~TRINITY_DN19253_c0_g1_i1.p1  ORF type:complete len:376 (+),score=48.62 TRINITY_DN19253_c0_g1_i1:77-1129(+)
MAILLLLPSLLLGATEPSGDSSQITQPWLYSEIDNRGPLKWQDTYEKCSGNEQSPINIRDATNDWSLKFLELHYEDLEAVIIQNLQSTLKVPMSSSHSTATDPNQHNKKYHLEQMHIHSPSEHQIGGGLYDMEIHLVHAESDPSEEGTSHLVIAIMFSSGTNSYNTWLNKFIRHLPVPPLENSRLYDQTLKDTPFQPFESSTQVHLNPIDVFPGSRDFFTYKGSLTTPPCNEGVSWYVLKEPVTMSASQLARIRDRMGLDQEQQYLRDTYMVELDGLWGNNRPVQLLNERTVSQYTHQVVNSTTEHQSDNIKLGVIGTVLGTCILIAVTVGLFIVVHSYCRKSSKGKLPK